MEVAVRWLIRRDMPEILDIEKRVMPHPWGEEEFLNFLRLRNTIGMVAEVENNIVGYMIYQLAKHDLHLLNFAVHPQFWRMGVGREMIDTLKDKLIQSMRKTIRLEVCETNMRAQQFYKANGLIATRVKRNYYQDGQDAYVFAWSIRNQPPKQQKKLFPRNRISECTEDDDL